MKFKIIRNDISNMEADAIVLPANSWLKIGSGTSKAIFDKAGRKELEEACGKIGQHDHVMFAVADQPYVQEDELFGFIHMFKRSYKGIGCLSYRGVMGNPVIFQGKFVPELLALTGDVGGKMVVKEHLSEVFQYEADSEMSLRDIDTPQES
mgnify:CR=1 FL=1